MIELVKQLQTVADQSPLPVTTSSDRASGNSIEYSHEQDCTLLLLGLAVGPPHALEQGRVLCAREISCCDLDLLVAHEVERRCLSAALNIFKL